MRDQCSIAASSRRAHQRATSPAGIPLPTLIFGADDTVSFTGPHAIARASWALGSFAEARVRLLGRPVAPRRRQKSRLLAVGCGISSALMLCRCVSAVLATFAAAMRSCANRSMGARGICMGRCPIALLLSELSGFLCGTDQVSSAIDLRVRSCVDL